MFRVVTNNSDGWKAITNIINTLNEEAVFNVTKEGILFKVLDISSVAFVDFLWKAEEFQKYEYSDDINIGIKVDDFIKIIKRAGKTDPVEISLGDGKGMKIKIGTNKEYDMSLINTTSSDRRSPKIEFDVMFKTTPKEILDIIGDINVVDTFITMSSSNGKIVFSTQGDYHSAKSTLDKSEVIKESQSRYDTSYISNVINSVSSFVEEINVYYSTKSPLKLEIPMSGVGTINYYLAPAN